MTRGWLTPVNSPPPKPQPDDDEQAIEEGHEAYDYLQFDSVSHDLPNDEYPIRRALLPGGYLYMFGESGHPVFVPFPPSPTAADIPVLRSGLPILRVPDPEPQLGGFTVD